MAALEWLLARPAEALELAEAAVTGSRDVGTRGDLAAALSILCLAELDVGDLASALRCADESVALAGEIGSTRVEQPRGSTPIGAQWPQSTLATTGRSGRPASAKQCWIVSHKTKVRR